MTAKRKPRPWAAREIELLYDRTLTAPEIAEKTGRTVRAVAHKRRRIGVPGAETWTDEEVQYLLRNLGTVFYDEMDLPHSPHAIFKKVQRLVLPQHGTRCPMCKSRPVKGFANSRHSGLCQKCSQSRRATINPDGRRIDNHGYVKIALRGIAVEDLPLARACLDGRNGSLHEHRWVMAKHLGRPLASTELVHHRNGDKTDNRLENLELLSTKEHHWGFGDFYQEWEECLAENKKMQELFAQQNESDNSLVPPPAPPLCSSSVKPLARLEPDSEP